ncbi:hypothetical protein CHS0354_040431 [Potamilus streckersoni]|uniref:HECT-type E3 ubiquitin transferase n=1 Tax=Potamilus streckersoni TaxID=2493646 RepID=A0AAE0SZX8_9BIVA|nr:hypothetical protein CHS0354_040431 [Potamilus streckersoni]
MAVGLWSLDFIDYRAGHSHFELDYKAGHSHFELDYKADCKAGHSHFELDYKAVSGQPEKHCSGYSNEPASVVNQLAVDLDDGAIGGALNQPANGIGVDTTGVVAASSSVSERHVYQYQTEARSTSVVNQPAVNLDDGAIGGALNQPANGIGVDTTGVVAASSSVSERHVYQYQTEAKSNLKRLHSMLKHPPQMLKVRRSQIVTDVLGLFEDSSTGTQLISTRFIDEDGVDGGGVTREMLTVFWNEVKERYFHGNEAFVPHLRPERLSEKKDFVTLGRIFSLSTATLQSIPIQICRSTLMVIIYDTCDVNPDTLLEDFLLFLDYEDRELLKSSLNSFDNMGEEDKDKLQEFFIKFGMGIIPRAKTLRQHVINLAQNELCIKPKFFCENMRKGIPQKHMTIFWMQMTLEHLGHLYEAFLISAENIWPKIRCETWPLRNLNEIRVYGYLSDLIQDLEEETLLSFVQFVTADRKIPSTFITIGFSDTQGITRCPVASTCAYRLDIPVSYRSFEEFKTEFMMVLNSDEAKTFSKN